MFYFIGSTVRDSGFNQFILRVSERKFAKEGSISQVSFTIDHDKRQ